jgi:ABC-type glycerol-3-phosphate transport system substrate-binding protein
LALLLLAAIAVGCGPAATPAAPTEAPAPDATEAPAATDAPQATEAPAATEASAAEPVTIVFWWWGEEEAPGLEQWLTETAGQFEQANPGIQVELVRQTTDGLIPAAQAAAAAQSGPDLQYFWPVGWFLEDMWNGNLAPLDDLIPEEIEHYVPAFRRYASWQGQTYAAPLYNIGNPWVYNKELFAQAGLDPENPPQTWDEFLAAGEALKAEGIVPIAAGMQDQWYADWPWMLLQPQSLSSEQDWYNAFLGVSGAKMTDAEYVATWARLKELIDAGFFPEDVNSLDLYEGFDLFLQGQAAMASPVQPLSATWAQQMGAEKLGAMLTPRFADGALGDKFPTASQYVAVTAWSQHKQEAAQFIAFMHTPDRIRALYETANAMMGDDRFEADWAKPGIDQQMYEWTYSNEASIALYYTAPPTVDEWIWPAAGGLFTGTLTPEQAGEMGEQTLEAWRQANPDSVENFKTWLQGQAG